MSDLEQKKRMILDRIDLLDVVAEHVTLRRSGSRWVGLCPFHAEKTPSFTVRPERGLFKCFGCGKGGDVFTFLQVRENVSFMEAMEMLAARAGVDLGNAPSGKSPGPNRTQLAKINSWAVRFFRSQLLDPSIGRSAREYLRSRQTRDETSERFFLGLATGAGSGLLPAATRSGIDRSLLLTADLLRQGDQGRYFETFRNRLMFPIRDATNRVIGFGGRTLGNDQAKYINTRQNLLFDKGRNLYGIDLAREAIGLRGRAIVVEGYTDCLAAHQAGFTETVATLGTAVTAAQVDLLRRYGDEMILLFDSDEAGVSAAERAIRVALPRCVTVRLARLPDDKDPSDFLSRRGSDEFSDLLKQAVDALQFKWVNTQRRFQGDGSDAKRREAILDFLRVVAEAADSSAVDAIQRGLLVNQVAHLLRMDREEINRLMVRLGPRRQTAASRATCEAGGPQPPTVPDAEQVAWGRVLEVVLNDPSVLATVDHVPDVSRIGDERDRRIGAVLWDLALQGGEFDLANVLMRFHDPADVARVMELADRGAKRGNCEKTFRLAVERIRRALQDEEVERRRQSFLVAQRGPGDSKSARAQFAGLSEAARKHCSYYPRRLSHRIPATEDEAENTNVSSTME